VHLVLAFLHRSDQPERAVARFREFGLPEPLLLRARSAAAALSTEVPVFAGLRNLALGVDEDRLLLVCHATFTSDEDVQRVITRIQLEMDADDPPMGTVVALPLIAAKRG
jgi:hypothetical protein